MNEQSSAFGTLINIFLEPKKALNDIRGHNGWLWYPLLIGLVLGGLIQVWYANRVDVSWFADQTPAPKAAEMTADQLRDAHARFTPGSMMFFGIVGTVGFFIWYLIQALYFMLVAKTSGYKEQGFGTWLSFICWTSFPGVLGLIATGVYMLTSSSRQLSPVDIDIVSLNTLLFHVPYAHTGQFIASSLRLTTIWSWVLMVIGMSAWTGKSMGKSAVVALAPYAVMYVVFILIAVL
jgi:hypothetical protein